MPTPSERLISTTCARCGGPIAYPGKGKWPRYCGRTCRQRAYEERRAAALVGAAGDGVPAAPVRQVLERVTAPRHPSTVPGWVAALGELAAQVRAGRLTDDPYRRDELRHALAAVAQALGVPAAGASTRPTTAPAPALSPPAAALAAHIGGAVLTSIERLAANTGWDEATVRRLLRELVDAGAATITRTAGAGGGVELVDVDRIAAHARI